MTAFTLLTFLFACGDKSNDTSAPSDTDDTSTTADGYSFEGMDFVFQSGEGFRLIGDRFSLSFTEDPREMNFSAGCNNHGGEYEVVDGVFEMAGMYATEMGCETELMEQDSFLATFFTSGPMIDHDGDTLTFTMAETTLVFVDENVAIPDQGLQDITWEIDTYFDGETASAYNVNVMPNVYFASDGTFTANMGCNGAGGSYTDDAGTLTLSIDTMTEAICDGDLNTIEGHIFNILSNTPVYEIDGNRITLMAGDKGIGAYASPE